MSALFSKQMVWGVSIWLCFFYFFVFDKVPIFGLNFETEKKQKNNRTPHPPKKNKTKKQNKKKNHKVCSYCINKRSYMTWIVISYKSYETRLPRVSYILYEMTSNVIFC